MEKFKNAFIVITVVVIVFTAVEMKFHLFQSITYQFSKERYICSVETMDYEKMLAKEPVCIKDKAYDGESFSETDLEKVTAFREMHSEISEKYNLASVAEAQKDFDKVLQVLSWLTENTWYNGSQMWLLKDDTRDILSYAFDKPFYRAINCRWKAVAFADCLVSVGIKAYPVCMQSADYGACHFTCRVYISELDKWCVFDPSFGCWFSDAKGEPIDILEMRELFLQDKEPVVHGYNFNSSERGLEAYVNGFLKLCISNLSTWEDNSQDKRESKSFSKRKEFNAEMPI